MVYGTDQSDKLNVLDGDDGSVPHQDTSEYFDSVI